MKAKLILAFAIANLFYGTTMARATPAVRCSVLAIEASNTNRGIDPALSQYAAVFKEPPFSAFNSFTLVRREVYEMPIGQPVKLSLPNSLGGALSLENQSGIHLDLVLTLERKGLDPVRIEGKAKPNKPFFAAGLRSKNGVWVFGVICTRDEFRTH